MWVCGEMRYSLGVGGGGGAGAADLGSELDADEAEHEGHGLLEVDEVGDGDREELVEAAQPDDGGDVQWRHRRARRCRPSRMPSARTVK